MIILRVPLPTWSWINYLGGIRGFDNRATISNNLVVFSVNEDSQGNTDLNGDGDKKDFVLHIYDHSTGVTTNLKIIDNAERLISNNLVVFSVREGNQRIDLNEDEDSVDGVLHIYDRTSGAITNLKLAGSASSISNNLVVLEVHEDSQGNTDLNGDGDAKDFNVLHIYDHSTGVTTNLELDTRFNQSIIDDNLVVFGVREDSQGNTDLNGDGDKKDFVLHIYDHSTEETTNLGVYGTSVQLDGNLIALTISENSQGNADLNGDGDTNDDVLHVIELSKEELFCGQPQAAYDSIIEGTDNDDLLQGTKGNDLIFGMDGNDLIYGGNGNDCILGGNGNDSIFGRGGDDTLFGEDGDDTIFGAQGNDILNGGSGNDHLMDDRGDDTLDGGEENDICYDKYDNNEFVSCEIKE